MGRNQDCQIAGDCNIWGTTRMKLAMLYERMSNDQVRCELCAHQCRISESRMGICQVRENRGGELYTHSYGPVIAQGVDPVEKKPLFHFFPGSRTYSIAAPGCNFRCSWCQNWEVSQLPRQQGAVMGRQRHPEEIVDDAENLACQSVAYTYTEPTIFCEYALDVARLADARGIHNVMVTNGYMTEDMSDAKRDCGTFTWGTLAIRARTATSASGW